MVKQESLVKMEIKVKEQKVNYYDDWPKDSSFEIVSSDDNENKKQQKITIVVLKRDLVVI